MKQHIYDKGLFLLTLVWVSVLLISCVSDSISPDTPEADLTEPMVTMAISVPQNNPTSETRAMSQEQEETISEVQVLAFDSKGLAAKRTGRITKRPTASDENKTFQITVKLPKGTFDLVLVANSNDIVKAANITDGDTKEVVYSRLVKALEANKKWDYEYIPFSGVQYQVKIDDTTNNKVIALIKLRRMLSKVEIKLSDTAYYGKENAGPLTAGSNFRIQQVLFYNTNTAGFLIPKLDKQGNYIKEERIPNSANTNTKPLVYEIGKQGVQEVVNQIYTFEAKAGTKKYFKDNPCIVIGGDYDTSGKTTYYRVDFVKRKKSGDNHRPNDFEDNDEFLPLLRNHVYNFYISEVHGPGFDKPEDALEAGPINIEGSLLQWEAGDIGEVVFDGQNFMTINPNIAEYGKDAMTGEQIIIKTDYLKDTPKCTVSSSPTEIVAMPTNWLQLGTIDKGKPVDISGVDAKEFTQLFNLTENKTKQERVAYIHVKLGRLTGVVKVIQTIKSQLSLKVLKKTKVNGATEWIEVDEIEFVQPKIGQEAQEETYAIEWSPASMPITVVDLGINNAEDVAIDWYSTAPYRKPIVGTDITDNTGKIELRVKPKPLANYEQGSFITGQQNLDIKLKVGEETISRRLSFKQIVQDIIVESEIQQLDGKSTHYIRVKSNVPWKLGVTRNISSGLGTKNVKVVQKLKDANFTNAMPQGSPYRAVLAKQKPTSTQGVKINLTTVNDYVGKKPTIITGYLDVLAESDGVTHKVSYKKEVLCASAIPQDGQEANTYVLDPKKGPGLLIPVRGANLDFTDNFLSDKSPKKLGIPESLNSEKHPLRTQIGDNTAYGTRLIWADVSTTNATTVPYKKGNTGKGLGANGLVSLIARVGKGKDGYLLVMPGDKNKQGNALVAVTENANGTGKILWSWHIWVLNNMPFEGAPMESKIKGVGKGEWMDRNLGAITNKPNTSLEFTSGFGVHGYYYQWGRKEPFMVPYPLNRPVISGVRAEPIQCYNSSGAIHNKYASWYYDVTKTIRGEDAVLQLLRNPMIAYNEYQSVYSDLWMGEKNNKGKSVLDPCPAGYRVPKHHDDNYDKVWSSKKWMWMDGHFGMKYNINTVHIKDKEKIPTSYYPFPSMPWPQDLNNPVDGGYYLTIDTSGMYWTSTPYYANNGNYLFEYLTIYTSMPPGFDERGGSMASELKNVRCVAD